ncbi:MAG TPA: anti-sigma-D factor RsdA [Pseudonocardia sp.]
MPDTNGAGTNGHSNGSPHPFGDPSRRSRTNGSPFDGVGKPLREGDGDPEPVDLVAVQADDELINALAAGMAMSTSAAGGPYRADDQVVALLSAWRADVAEEPIPELLDLDTAVAAVQAGIKAKRATRSARTRHLVPVAAAAAFLVLVGGGVSITSATAEPDSALWPVTKVLFSERAASVEAAVRVSDKIEHAKQALNEGQPQAAAAELQQAQSDLSAVRPQEGKAQLVDVKDFLVAKAAETPQGTKVDPATPLKTDRARPIPAGVALSQAPSAAGTLTPTPSTTEAPTSTTLRSTRPRPKPVAPEKVSPLTLPPSSPAATPSPETPTKAASTTTKPTVTSEGSADTTTVTSSSKGTTDDTTTEAPQTS